MQVLTGGHWSLDFNADALAHFALDPHSVWISRTKICEWRVYVREMDGFR